MTGGLFYPTVAPGVAIVGSKTTAGVITRKALTSSYQAESGTNPTKTFTIGSFPKLNLDVSYRTGTSETTAAVCIQVEDSPDRVNWYKLQNEAVSAGVSTLTDREFQHVGGAGATTYNFSIGLDVFYKFVRVSVREANVSSNVGSAYVEMNLLGA